MGERKTPTEALADARADKQHAEAEAIARSERDAAYPAIAEARLKELAKAIEAEVPPDLRLEIVYGSGGRLGNRGLKNLSMKLFDSERVISQGRLASQGTKPSSARCSRLTGTRGRAGNWWSICRSPLSRSTTRWTCLPT